MLVTIPTSRSPSMTRATSTFRVPHSGRRGGTPVTCVDLRGAPVDVGGVERWDVRRPRAVRQQVGDVGVEEHAEAAGSVDHRQVTDPSGGEEAQRDREGCVGDDRYDRRRHQARHERVVVRDVGAGGSGMPTFRHGSSNPRRTPSLRAFSAGGHGRSTRADGPTVTCLPGVGRLRATVVGGMAGRVGPNCSTAAWPGRAGSASEATS